MQIRTFSGNFVVCKLPKYGSSRAPSVAVDFGGGDLYARPSSKLHSISFHESSFLARRFRCFILLASREGCDKALNSSSKKHSHEALSSHGRGVPLRFLKFVIEMPGLWFANASRLRPRQRSRSPLCPCLPAYAERFALLGCF